MPSRTDHHDVLSERLFEQALDVMAVLDFEGRFVRLNRSGRELLGIDGNGAASPTLLDLVHPMDHAAMRERIANVRAGRGGERFRFRARSADGGWRWLETRTALDSEDQLVYAVARDITDAEDADADRLIESFADAQLGMAVMAPDGSFRRVNAALCRLVGRSQEELLELSIFEIVAEDDAASGEWSRERLQAGDRTAFQAETRLRRADGGPAVALVSTTLVRNPRREPRHYLCQFFDLTRRNEAQERLVANEAKLAEAQQIARLGSWEWEIATDSVVWSDELYRIYGVRPDRFPGSYGSYLDKVHADDRARVARVIETAVAERRGWSLDYRIVRPDGEVRMIHARGEVVLDDHGRPSLVRGTAQDVTESRRVEDALRAAEQLFRRAFDDAPIGMALIDLEGRWLRLNRSIAQMLG
ncbi:MAG TPA: PAS domain S-box protein, partial [Solirubrobacteraceae bacterium]